MSNIGRKARRKVSVAGTARPSAMQGYEFTIEQMAGDCFIDKDGNIHLIENCQLLPPYAASFDPAHRPDFPRIVSPFSREPIKPGVYGPVRIHTSQSIGNPFTIGLEIYAVYLTADELNEAAHLFNQLAEQLRSSVSEQAMKEFEHNKSLSAANGPLPPSGGLFMSPLKATEALNQATRLLEAIHSKHWPELPPIKPLDTLAGVLDQIDHITASLVRDSALQNAARGPRKPLPIDPLGPHEFDAKDKVSNQCKWCHLPHSHPRHAVTIEQPPAIEIKLSPRVDKAIADAVKQAVNDALAGYPKP